MAHRNARLTVHGRRLLITRVVTEGRPVAHMVKELGCSTGYKWLARSRAEGEGGLLDRSSIAHRLPRKTPPQVEEQVCRLRRERKLGPRRAGPCWACRPRRCTPCSPATACTAWLDRPPANRSAATNATGRGS